MGLLANPPSEPLGAFVHRVPMSIEVLLSNQGTT